MCSCKRGCCDGASNAGSWLCITVFKYHKISVLKKPFLQQQWLWPGNSPLPGHPKWCNLHCTEMKNPSEDLAMPVWGSRHPCWWPSCWDEPVSRAQTAAAALRLQGVRTPSLTHCTTPPPLSFVKWPLRKAISKVTSAAGDTQPGEGENLQWLE